jgi:sulfatase modifying factor 1
MRVQIKSFIKSVIIVQVLLTVSVEVFAYPKKIHQANGLIYIPSGFYHPLRKVEGRNVRMRSFYIKEGFVTNQEFLEFVKANPEWRRSRIKRIFADRSYLINWENDTTLNSGTGRQVDPSAPVAFVSWFAAKAYCHWKGVELPSFDELQYAIEILGKRTSKRCMNAASSLRQNNRPWEWVEDINSFGFALQQSDSQSEVSSPLCAGAAVEFNNISDYELLRRFSYLSSIKPYYCEPNLSFRWIIKILR